jgi:hypothetical protein
MWREEHASDGVAELGTWLSIDSASTSNAIRRASEYPFVCKPDDGSAMSRSPASIARPSTMFARATTPTMKPATSYSPGA